MGTGVREYGGGLTLVIRLWSHLGGVPVIGKVCELS